MLTVTSHHQYFWMFSLRRDWCTSRENRLVKFPNIRVRQHWPKFYLETFMKIYLKMLLIYYWLLTKLSNSNFTGMHYIIKNLYFIIELEEVDWLIIGMKNNYIGYPQTNNSCALNTWLGSTSAFIWSNFSICLPIS